MATTEPTREAMPTRPIDILSIDELDNLLTAQGPILIYKHSLTCGTSARAYEEIQDLVASVTEGVSVGVVRVQVARAVSNEIARRFGVRHESPQVLLLRDGKVVWRASHYGVTAEAIGNALAGKQSLAPGSRNASSSRRRHWWGLMAIFGL